MLMEKSFGWCFIGTGTLAKQVAKEILASNRHHIVSCYTRNPEKGKLFADKYHCISTATAEEAINMKGVDGVYIVTPHNAHYRYAKLALELGKPVLCEKAFTVNARETDELIALAREKKVYLCEAMWTWFGEPAKRTVDWISQGQIGKVERADFTYCMKSIHYAPRVSDPRRAGGALLDITIYPITYAYRLFGYPVSITSHGKVKNEVDHWEEIELTFPAGEKVSIRGSIVDFKGLEKMDIKGSKGHIKAFQYHCSRKLACQKSLLRKETFTAPGSGLSIGYLPEFDAVAREIREGRTESADVPLKATSDVMHILDDIRAQIGLSYTALE